MTNNLYSPDFERDSCGFGLIAQMDNQASHSIVATAIGSLARLTHRGAVAADGKSGDGCGLLIQMPQEFFRAVATESSITLPLRFAVGQFFLPRDGQRAEGIRKIIAEEAQALDLALLGWRSVPTVAEACGAEALKTLPSVEQAFLSGEEADDDAFERLCYRLRRRVEKRCAADSDFFAVTCSSRVIGYKGLVMPEHLPDFYPDLRDPRFASALVSYHQRFSTNTWPEWRLCQPFRILAHNGELNTIQGNRNWARARAPLLQSDLLPMDEVLPAVGGGSDSFSLDNMLELLVQGGMDFFKALRLLIPPAWHNVPNMAPELRAFYEYHSMRMEAWDGPAGLVLNNGQMAVCALDRNGLRPARYVITRDRIINIASEVGVFDYAHQDITAQGRVGPGQILAVDLRDGQLLDNSSIDLRIQSSAPYGDWLAEYAEHLDVDDDAPEIARSVTDLVAWEKAFGVSMEEEDQVIRVLAEGGQEAVGSMGDDTPVAVLSTQPRHLADYFRQQFAQVTNPPIDPLRESLVMSLNAILGTESNLFAERPEYARRIEVHSPVLSDAAFQALVSRTEPAFRAQIFSICYPRSGDLESAVTSLCAEVVAGVQAGAVIVVLDDSGLQRDQVYIPALMAAGAVHHALIDAGLRTRCNILVATAHARDPHHFATLIGYGATAVYPYLAYAIVRSLAERRAFSQPVGVTKALANYRKGIDKGLYKILSKMGISTLASYRSSQLFEALGLSSRVVERCFRGTVTRIEGADFRHLEADVRQLLADAWRPHRRMSAGGQLKYIHGGEYHAYNPDVVASLQAATRSGRQEDYRSFAELVNGRPVTNLRDLLHLRGGKAIPLHEVEPVEGITPRFDTAAMSLGALSPEAHEALAIAMNTIGGRSNSGEGGEDPARYHNNKVSKIKQIASGRFGVTPEYAVNAEELQIKIAQGAKPGEGGQLPGHKVSGIIARLRYAKEGVALISPPPHHDIYSIEDLAQLIFDLKQVNPSAFVSVKLVSEAGVGTVAAGVAKAYADRITIAGYDGGTGASPLTSVKYAGSPWELGLAETQVTLRKNFLRHRVRLQVDGGFKTGLDVVKGALLGAESFGFGTAPMIVLGCKYLRICHLNNCATGVATQDETLRKHFKGLPELVINYFRFVAEEVREIMAELGIRRFDDLVGRSDLLEIGKAATDKQAALDLRPLLGNAALENADHNIHQQDRNPPFDRGELAEQIVADARPALEERIPTRLHYRIQNTHRSIAARLGGEIAKRYGNAGLPDDCVHVELHGTAGQSFGAFSVQGMTLRLHGDANDYVGKAMNGGRIIIAPPENVPYVAAESAIIGNTCLYGATGGMLHAAGRAGERFAVRNSGAIAVIEGAGDHACEYMTGGQVIILGRVGVNFGAGMTGGLAFVRDADGQFPNRVNGELVNVHRIDTESMRGYEILLKRHVKRHLEWTGSLLAQDLLNNWSRFVAQVWLVVPKAAKLDVLLEEAS
ncbi:glutamate synthase large subunit [Acidithiobacillus sp. AMEEHan]|uniref:glutamate synthase large subunit n=1 Tax=Acidithiobacillus sp. AMEEHan TaxID=2994951 RepID=UPI0027E4B704|nr:glutamate synthase large subunit [Acidithiobacillus sp. AMEEHan]